MKNEQLKKMLAQRLSSSKQQQEAIVLNAGDLLFVEGGKGIDCPKLQSCGTFGDCNGKCGVKGITVDINPLG